LGVKWQGKATYHFSCHLRGLNVRPPINLPQAADIDVPRVADRILSQIAGLEYVPLERAEQCCGFGGTFAAKYPQVSGAMVRDKGQCIEKTGAPVVISNEGGCTMNTGGSCPGDGVNVRFMHVAEIIAEGLGLLPRDQ